MSGPYDEKPWLALYDADMPAAVQREYDSAIERFRASGRRAPNAEISRYCDAPTPLRSFSRVPIST